MEATKPDVLETDKTTRQVHILKRCVCVILHCSYLGNTRKVSLDTLTLKDERDEDEVHADKDELAMSKQLLDRKDLKQAKGVIESAKAYMRSIATQGNRVFGAGTYLVPLASVLDMEDRLKQFQADLAVAVDALVTKYPAMVEKRKADLRELFDAKDYLTAEEVRHEYALDWDYRSFSAPDQLEEVDRAVLEAAQAKHAAQLSDAFEEIVVQLRASALTVMQELAERLKPGPDGKPKAIRGTALRDLQDFAAALPKRNTVQEDDALEQAVAKVVSYADGVDVESLRRMPALREGLQAAAEEAVVVLEELVATRRNRGIAFGKI